MALPGLNIATSQIQDLGEDNACPHISRIKDDLQFCWKLNGK